MSKTESQAAEENAPSNDEREDGRKLVKLVKNGDEIQVTWSEGNAVFSLKCNEAPDPALLRSIEDLNQYAIDSLPFISSEYHNKLAAYGVQFDWKGDDNRRNGEILVAVEQSRKVFTKLKTPKKLADNYLDEKKKARWDSKAVVQFDIVEKEAFRYVDGERAQLPLAAGANASQQEKDEANAEIDNELPGLGEE